MSKSYDFKGMDVWNESKLINQASSLQEVTNADGTISYREKAHISVLRWSALVSSARNSIDADKIDSYLNFFLKEFYYIKDVERYAIDTNKRPKRRTAESYIDETIAMYGSQVMHLLTPDNGDIDICVIIYKQGLIDSNMLYNCLQNYIKHLNYTFHKNQYASKSYLSNGFDSELGNIWLTLDYLIKRYDNTKTGFITYVNKYYRSIAYRKSAKKSQNDSDNVVNRYVSETNITSASNKSLSTEMEMLIDMLDEQTRNVIVLWHIEGYNRNEIASMLELSNGMVSNINKNGLERLRELYRDYLERGSNFGFNTFNYTTDCKKSTTNIDAE